MDPHFPYDSVKTTGTTMDRFLSEVGQVDRSMATLLEAIDRLGLRERTVLVFVADHGEGFGQHGARYHTVNLYEELLRVPVFIRAPGVAPRRVDAPISLVDLGPTILDLFGQPTPGHFLGRSLVPHLRGEPPVAPRPIFAEKKGVRTLILGSRKVILDREKGREELYDLDADPGEQHNLADSLDEEGRNALALTRLFFETHALPDQR
jgi:arylsulfatase A-like enzyme